MENRLSLTFKSTIKTFLCASMELALIRPLYAKSTRWRNLFFDALGYNSNTTLLYTNLGPEQFLIDAHDQAIGKIIFATGEFEFHKFILAVKLLRKHQVYDEGPIVLIDMGANIGIICIPAVARDYVKRAIAIEPHPHNCRLLRTNVALNGLTEAISVYECACGIADGEELELELSEDNLGDHRIYVKDAPGLYNEHMRRIMRINSNALDTDLDGYARVRRVCARRKSKLAG